MGFRSTGPLARVACALAAVPALVWAIPAADASYEHITEKQGDELTISG